MVMTFLCLSALFLDTTIFFSRGPIRKMSPAPIGTLRHWSLIAWLPEDAQANVALRLECQIDSGYRPSGEVRTLGNAWEGDSQIPG